MKSLTLLGLLGCHAYPDDANLVIDADTANYHVYAETQGNSYQLGMPNNPEWLYRNVGPNTRIQIHFQKESEKEIYEGFFLSEYNKALSPSLPEILERAGAIGADCGFHHPDSHDPCFARRRMDGPVSVSYKISTFPGEKREEDNETTVFFSSEELDKNAETLSYLWREQKRKEVEKEEKSLAEKGHGLK